jgi:alpha-glucoside transport system permease protein
MTVQPPPLPDPDVVEGLHAEERGPVAESGGIEPVGPKDWLAILPIRIAAAVGIPLIGGIVLWWAFTFLRDSDANKAVIVVVAVIVGVFGVFGLYWAMDFVNERLPERWKSRIRPWIFAGPAVAVLVLFLVWPTINTIWSSFLDAKSEEFVGLDNYQYAFTEDVMLESFRNNLIWLVVGTALTVGLGLLVATLVDRLGKRAETIAKSLIFLPMAISFVGASVVWNFIYSFRPEGSAQIGLLNALWTGLGGEPQFWLSLEPWNNLLLIVVLVWLQTGFTMVILSSAIKGVPGSLLEAARIDGATEVQIFWKVIIPTIKSTIVVVTTTMVILILKVFDIVWVMTSGQFSTEVIASRMIREMINFGNKGRGAAIAVILLLAVIPIMIMNVRRFREEEALR